MFKNILAIALVMSLPIQGRASDLYLRLPEAAHEVLAPKQQALTLNQVNQLVASEQIDIQISYEKLLQAQKKISLARAQYFPYGLGTVAAMYFLQVWNPILLVELVTSLPSKVYNVQSEKNMSMAQDYSNRALRENIKNQVAHLYYTILKEEGALKLARMELQLLEQLYNVIEERVILGLSTEEELRNLELRLLDLRDICLKFAGYLSAEKAAFNTMISKSPEQGKAIELQTEGVFLNPAEYGLSSEIVKLNALDRAPEIVAADYMITAAARSKSSVAWSVLSFSGIGFGYWGRVQVAGSKVDEARLIREQVEVNLANQSYVINNSFHRTLDHFVSEKNVFDDTASFYSAEFARYNARDISLDRLLEAGIIYLKDFNELVVAHYDTLIKLNDLERIALGSVRGTALEGEKIEFSFVDLGNNKYSLSLNSEDEVKEVEYVFGTEGLKPMKVFNRGTGFAVVLKLASKSDLNGHANVTLKNGKTITKKFKF